MANTATATTIKLADVKIRDGFNARSDQNGSEDAELRNLAGSIRLVGVVNPISLDEDGYLVAGHRRVAAAKLAGLTEVPYTIVAGDEKVRLAAHGAENVARKNLTPAEEAELIARMFEQGYTSEGAAEVLGMSKSLVTRRETLLQIPPELRVLWGPGGTTRLEVVPFLAALLEKIPTLGEVILHAEQARAAGAKPERTQEELQELRDKAYEDGFEEDYYLDDEDEVGLPPSVDKLLDQPTQYLTALQRLYTPQEGKRQPKGTPRWPTDLVICTQGAQIGDGFLKAIKIPEKARQQVLVADRKAREGQVWNVHMRVEELDFDAARAADATVKLGTTEILYDLPWLKARIKSDIIPCFETTVDQAIADYKGRSSAAKTPKRTDEQLTPFERDSRDKARRTREKEKEWKGRAAIVNEELGLALLNKLSEVKVDAKVARIFAEATLGPRVGNDVGGYGMGRPNDRAAGKLAAAGLRYVMPGWQTVVPTPTKADPNKTRTDYLSFEDAEKKLWEWFDQAKTVEEIFGRAIIIHAAAMWANEHVLAQSHRLAYSDGGTVVIAQDPSEQLRKLIDKSIPASVKKLATEIQKFDASKAS